VSGAGNVLLALAAIASLIGLSFSLTGRILGRRLYARAGMWAVYGTLVAAAAASLLLLGAFLARDFSNLYVYEHSSRALSVAYTISAFWAGNAGSLLLWLLLLTAFAVAAGRGAWRRDAASAPCATAALSVMSLFFSLLLLFGPSCNPFSRNPVSPTPADGLGLNPMLQNLGMIIHPVALYVGYVAMAVPFALMVAGLAGGRPLAMWLAALRRWVLVGWLFLTIGNVVGAWWAYVTLGWGGYWAWDPVENASLIPWLTATALLHAVITVQRKGRQRVWVVCLASVTFLLTVFGTFLTRSGVAASVHAFQESGMIPWFVVFMVAMLALAVTVIVWRLPSLRGDGSVAPLLGESSIFLYTNLVLSVITFVILWGVVFPPIVRALGGGEVSLGTDFFNVVTAPLGLVLLLLMTVCTLVRWAHGSLRRLELGALGIGAVGLVALALLVALGVRKGYPVAAFALSAMTIAAIGLRFVRGSRRRYGSFLVHLGLAILVIGLAGSWAYKQSVEGDVAKGGSLSLQNVQVVYQDLRAAEKPGKSETWAVLALSLGGASKGELQPTLEFYPAADQLWTRVARHSSLGGDVYVSLLAVNAQTGTISLRLEVHPLINWLWIGGVVMALGGAIALWPGRGRRRKVPAMPSVRAGEA
jgi:cytochrome c-type biogenesis protein CcmF